MGDGNRTREQATWVQLRQAYMCCQVRDAPLPEYLTRTIDTRCYDHPVRCDSERVWAYLDGTMMMVHVKYVRVVSLD